MERIELKEYLKIDEKVEKFIYSLPISYFSPDVGKRVRSTVQVEAYNKKGAFSVAKNEFKKARLEKVKIYGCVRGEALKLEGGVFTYDEEKKKFIPRRAKDLIIEIEKIPSFVDYIEKNEIEEGSPRIELSYSFPKNKHYNSLCEGWSKLDISERKNLISNIFKELREEVIKNYFKKKEIENEG